MIFFDIDNTLIDYNASEKKAITELILTNCNYKINEEQYEYWHIISQKYFQKFLDKILTFEEQGTERILAFAKYCNIDMNDKKALEIFKKYQPILLENWSLFDDVKYTLDHLRSHRMGIISNGKSLQQSQKLTVTGIENYFEIKVFSEDAGYSKPSLDIFKYAQKKSGVDFKNMVYVGDNYDVDILPCIELGIKSFYINRDLDVNEHENQIKSLKELTEYLD